MLQVFLFLCKFSSKVYFESKLHCPTTPNLNRRSSTSCCACYYRNSYWRLLGFHCSSSSECIIYTICYIYHYTNIVLKIMTLHANAWILKFSWSPFAAYWKVHMIPQESGVFLGDFAPIKCVYIMILNILVNKSII